MAEAGYRGRLIRVVKSTQLSLSEADWLALMARLKGGVVRGCGSDDPRPFYWTEVKVRPMRYAGDIEAPYVE